MGLSVVHGIVKNCGGAIDVRSETGKGTTFNVFLPALENRVETEMGGGMPIPGGSERILLVDDEPMITDVVGIGLESLGYRVVRSNKSVEALRLFEEHPDRFDLAALSGASDGFSGAEIEQAVVSSLYTAHAKSRLLDTGIVLEELAMTRPLSVLMAEKVTYLRQWAAQRTIPAN